MNKEHCGFFAIAGVALGFAAGLIAIPTSKEIGAGAKIEFLSTSLEACEQAKERLLTGSIHD